MTLTPAAAQPVTDDALIGAIYESVLRRETRYDGIYYTGVRSTGIVCRPSCRSRTPLLRNIRFYTSMDAALAAGFRPCKRCKPEAPGTASPEVQLAVNAKALIEAALPRSVPLGELAAALHLSPYHLQRVFKRQTGQSPSDYTIGRKLDNAQQQLAASTASITEIAHVCGFSSAAYFAACFQKHLGMSPTQFREEPPAKSL